MVTTSIASTRAYAFRVGRQGLGLCAIVRSGKLITSFDLADGKVAKKYTHNHSEAK